MQKYLKVIDEIQELFSNQDDSEPCNINTVKNHFLEKRVIIERQLVIFNERLNFAAKKEVETNDELGEEKYGNVSEDQYLVDNTLIYPLLKEILSGEYNPPQFFPERHMWILLFFYDFVAPELKEIHLSTLLKIDIATLRLFEVFIPESENIRKSVIEDSRVRKVINKKERTKQANEKYILNALKDMGVQYDGNNPKKPFIFKGVERTVNYVGDKIYLDGLSRDYIKKTIRRMRDEGKLSHLGRSK
jgi:hypothetical protein